MSLKFIRIATLAMLTVFVSGVALADSGVNLRGALEEAYRSNPELKAARARLSVVDEDYYQAISGFQPDITGVASYTASNTNRKGATDTTSDPKTFEVTLLQSLYSGGSTVAKTKQTTNLINSERANLKSVEQGVFLSGIREYMSVLRDKKINQLTSHNYRVLLKHLDATRARFKIGSLTKTDVRQAEARLARAKAEKMQARSRLNKSKAGFERVFGISPLSLTTPEVGNVVPRDLQSAIQVAKSNNPQIELVRYSGSAAKNSTRSLEGANYPQIDLSGSINKTYDPSTTAAESETGSFVGVSLTLPFYTGGENSSKIKQARHYENQKRMELFKAERDVVNNVIDAWSEYESAVIESTAYKSQIKATKLALKGVQVENDVGLRTTLDVLDAEQEYLDAQVSHVVSETNKVVAAYGLLSTMGMLTAKDLQLGVEFYNLDSAFRNTQKAEVNDKDAIFIGDFKSIK